jgi:hypothetical protein
MANVSNARLKMGRVSDRMEFAEVTFSINFSAAEVAQNLSFGLYTALFERDDKLDFYIPTPNGAFDWGDARLSIHSIENEDGRIPSFVDTKIIRPNGQNTRLFTVRKDFDLGVQEDGNEEYRAFINVVPEITSGQAWTNEVSINLG